MVLSEWVTVSAPQSLAVIAALLAATIVASMMFPAKSTAHQTDKR
jgi:hypothetical protein